MFYLDEHEEASNIGRAKALIDADLNFHDLKEIVDYLSVFIDHNRPMTKGGAE
jgi:hypothetical protein